MISWDGTYREKLGKYLGVRDWKVLSLESESGPAGPSSTLTTLLQHATDRQACRVEEQTNIVAIRLSQPPNAPTVTEPRWLYMRSPYGFTHEDLRIHSQTGPSEPCPIVYGKIQVAYTVPGPTSLLDGQPRETIDVYAGLFTAQVQWDPPTETSEDAPVERLSPSVRVPIPTGLSPDSDESEAATEPEVADVDLRDVFVTVSYPGTELGDAEQIVLQSRGDLVKTRLYEASLCLAGSDSRNGPIEDESEIDFASLLAFARKDSKENNGSVLRPGWCTVTSYRVLSGSEDPEVPESPLS